MRFLLLPLFLFGLALPAFSESTYWLLIVGRNGGKYDYGTTSGVWKIPTSSEMACEAEGLKIMGNKEIHGKIFEHLRYACIKGTR